MPLQIADITMHNHGPSIIGDETDTPPASWLAVQKVKSPEGGKWYRAFPVSGGAIDIHESHIGETRDATADDMDELVNGDSPNPAADAVMYLYNRSFA